MGVRPICCCGLCFLGVPAYLFGRTENGFGLDGSTDSLWYNRRGEFQYPGFCQYGPGADVSPYHSQLHSGIIFSDNSGDLQLTISAATESSLGTVWSTGTQTFSVSNVPETHVLSRTAGSGGDATLTAHLMEKNDKTILYVPIGNTDRTLPDYFFANIPQSVVRLNIGINWTDYYLRVGQVAFELGTITDSGNVYPNAVAYFGEYQLAFRQFGLFSNSSVSFVANGFHDCASGESVLAPSLTYSRSSGIAAVSWEGNTWSKSVGTGGMTFPLSFDSGDKTADGSTLVCDDITYRYGDSHQIPYDEDEDT